MAGQYSVAIESQRQNQFAKRRQLMENYLGQLPSGDQEISKAMAEDLNNFDRPLANTVVIIPVAAHQEAANVRHTVSEYARQRDCEPFTVVLGLNAPAEMLNIESVAATEQAVNDAIVEHPDLDIRYTIDYYGEPVIGEIRRDLWNAVLYAAQQTGNIRDGSEIIGINHDIDLVKLASTYISRVQKLYAKRDARHLVTPVSPPRGSYTKHAFSPEHPNISAAVFWNDFYYRLNDSAYEAGIIIPMSLYANQGGFKREAVTHEVGGLTSNSGRTAKLLKGTYMETSPRRYIWRMNDHGYNIWSTDSFSATDECRTSNQHPDITQKRKLDIVRQSLPGFASKFADLAVKQTYINRLYTAEFDAPKLTPNELLVAYFYNAMKISQLGHRILSSIVGSPDLAEDFTILLGRNLIENVEIKVS